MKLFTSIVAIATLIVGFSACERASQIVQPATPEIEEKRSEIAIGIVLPLTGHVAATGERMEQGFALAIDEITKANVSEGRLKFIFEDDMGTPEGAVQAFNKLIGTDSVVAILGPSTSSATQAGFPIAQAHKIVALSPTAGASGLTDIGDFVFRIPLTTAVAIAAGIKETHAKLGYQRVATLYDDTDLFSTDQDTVLREVFKANGIEGLPAETFQTGDTDFPSQLTRIKALNPDAIFVSALPPEKPGILIQARHLGLTAPIIISSLTDVEVAAAGPAAEGAITFVSWISTDDTPGNQAFVQNYSETFGMEPDGFAMVAYTSVYILAEAIKNVHSTDSAAIRDALADIRDFDTVFGKFSFAANGDAIYDPKVLRVKDGRLQAFE
ncbi:MAG: ABC transporter substrate-binding protein [Candidatus Poribacteria bacterium]|nr:ABC transporter substrate-binding protein [Candidatus Poribacteria bacterium]